MQKYVVHCREEKSSYASNDHKSKGSPVHLHHRLAEPGTCNSDEVCIPGTKEVWEGSQTYTARCVKQDSFRTSDWIESNKRKAGLGNHTASVVLSQSNRQTPLRAESIEIDALDDSGAVQEKSCTDCAELRTAQLPPESDTLTMRAWLNTKTSGTLQVAGIIWFVIQLAAE